MQELLPCSGVTLCVGIYTENDKTLPAIVDNVCGSNFSEPVPKLSNNPLPSSSWSVPNFV